MTVSPAWKSGIVLPSLAICSCSSCWMMFMSKLLPLRGLSDLKPADFGVLFSVRAGPITEFDLFVEQGARDWPSSPLPVGDRGRPEQIRPPLAGDALRFVPPPPFDGCMVAVEKHFWDRAALPFARARVMRVFQAVRLEALLQAGGLLAHHARQEPHAGVEHHHGGHLAAGEHV